VVLMHDRRRVVHFHVTVHSTARWIGQQIIEAFCRIRRARSTSCGIETLFMEASYRGTLKAWASKIYSLRRQALGRMRLGNVIGSIRWDCLELRKCSNRIDSDIQRQTPLALRPLYRYIRMR
jgi:hypothetical protein